MDLWNGPKMKTAETVARPEVDVPIIVADDDETARELYLAVAREHGWRRIHVADNADDAILHWRDTVTGGGQAVVILDISMPGTNGLDAAERILREHPGTLVIIVSGLLDEKTTRRARRIGVHACVSKAQLVTDLPAMVSTWTNGSTS